MHGSSNLLEPHSHLWGQNTINISSLFPKRDWGPQRVKKHPPQTNIMQHQVSGTQCAGTAVQS